MTISHYDFTDFIIFKNNFVALKILENIFFFFYDTYPILNISFNVHARTFMQSK